MEKLRFHDPLVVRDGDTYYCFSTDTNVSGVQISKSRDLVHWALQGTAFSSTPSPVYAHTQSNQFWAPDVFAQDGKYELYFCSSRFGTTQSVIGRAVSDTLAGPYTYTGDVLKTYHTDGAHTPNAIDPCVFQDRDHQRYLIYGSFFDGIYLIRLNPDGFVSESGYGIRIAGGGHRPVEGPYLYYHEASGFYYLFVSYGSLTYDYTIRVGRATSIAGPYIDSQGFELTDLDPIRSTGDKIAGGYHFDLPGVTGFMAPGHNSLVHLPDGPYLVHHIRREGEIKNPQLHLRKIFFNAVGQLYVSPVPYDGKVGRDAAPEAWQAKVSIIRFDRFNNGVTYGRKVDLQSLPYQVFGGGQFTLALYGKTYSGHSFVHDNRLYLTGISPDGECIWGMG